MAVGTMKGKIFILYSGGKLLELNYLNHNPNSKAKFLYFIVEEKNRKREKA